MIEIIIIYISISAGKKNIVFNVGKLVMHRFLNMPFIIFFFHFIFIILYILHFNFCFFFYIGFSLYHLFIFAFWFFFCLFIFIKIKINLFLIKFIFNPQKNQLIPITNIFIKKLNHSINWCWKK